MLNLNSLLLALLQDGAQPTGGAPGNQMVWYLVMIGAIFIVFYFIVFRPERQRKAKLQAMINDLKAGDKIITIGGIHGTVSGVTDQTVVIRVADQVKIEVSRSAVGTVVNPEVETKKEEKK